MTIAVHPDPGHPAGGFAFLELPDGALPDTPVAVAVFDRYAEVWLAPEGAGQGGWQTEPHLFGPYEVHRHDGADWLRLGPEIVNRLQEYKPLRFDVNGQGHDVTWPDDVPPLAGAATPGGLQATPRIRPEQVTPVVTEKPTPPAPPAPVQVPEPAPADEPAKEEEASPRRGSLLVVLLCLALLAAALAWWFWPRNEPDVSARCSPTDLAAVEGGFGERVQAIRGCAGSVRPETVLRLTEDAAQSGDADALLLFGTLYDGAELDRIIEKVIGLSFDHDAARAAEYYSRAAAAGSAKARERLTATCAQLAGSGDTLSKGAHDDFCR